MTNHEKKYRIYDEWNDAVRHRDVARLTALYAPNATLESPALLLLDERFDGTVTGREEIASFFNTFFDRLDESVADWFRTGDLFVDGRLMAWERAAEEASGARTRSVETLEIENGLILHHRVYWSWAGFKTLASLLPSRPSPRSAGPLILVKSSASES